MMSSMSEDNPFDNDNAFGSRADEKTLGEQRAANARYAGHAEQAAINAPAPSKLGAWFGSAGKATVSAGASLGGYMQTAAKSAGSGMKSATPAVVDGLKASAGAVAGGVSAVAAKIPSAGGGKNEELSKVALCLVSCVFELAVSASTAYERQDLSRILDEVTGARSTPELAQSLLDLWYFMRTDHSTQWGVPQQKRWLRALVAVKCSDRKDCGSAAVTSSRTVVEALREFSANTKSAMADWDSFRREAWMQAMRMLLEAFECSPPPPLWLFPKLAIGKYASCETTSFGLILKGTEKAAGAVLVQSDEMLQVLATGGSLIPSRQPPMSMRGDGDGDEGAGTSVTFLCSSQPLQDRSFGCPSGGSEKFEKLVNEESEKLYVQRCSPISLHNRSSDSLKVCFYAENDKLCVVPLGGVNGFGVVTMTPGRRVTVRPPNGDAWFLKVFEPKIIDRKLYDATVRRGQAVELRSHDCSVV